MIVMNTLGFISRNVFIVSIRGVRNVKNYNCTPRWPLDGFC
jgi:hypothetical protein